MGRSTTPQAARAVNPRPRPVTVIGWFFVALGGVTLAAGLWPPIERWSEFKSQGIQAAWPHAVRLLAILGGAQILRGIAWGRVLLVGWMGFHVILSMGHSVFAFILHSLLFGSMAYWLFLPGCTAFFMVRKPCTRNQ